MISHTDILALLPEYGLAIVVIGVAIESLGVPLPGGIPLIAAAFYAGATGQMDPVSVGLAGYQCSRIGRPLYAVGQAPVHAGRSPAGDCTAGQPS